jgi:hypothetical protein
MERRERMAGARKAMQKTAALLVAHCLPLVALAQVPGPPGWFVITGINLKTGQTKCAAGIVTGDQLWNIYAVGELFWFLPGRRSGPFASVEAAQDALATAGWSKVRPDYYQAPAGCD